MSSTKELDESVQSAELHVDSTETLSWRTSFCLAATLLAYFATLFSLVGTGIYSYEIGLALGDTTKIIWLSNVSQILTAILAPPS